MGGRDMTLIDGSLVQIPQKSPATRKRALLNSPANTCALVQLDKDDAGAKHAQYEDLHAIGTLNRRISALRNSLHRDVSNERAKLEIQNKDEQVGFDE